jgi:short-subunit dehydrogenase
MGQRRSIAGLRILVTGASQGIGRALAEAAARRGAKIIAAARSRDLLDELAQEVRLAGGILQPVVADVTDPEGRKAMVDVARRHFLGLDVLINNAGIGATGHFVEASPERLRQIMEVNFFGVTEMTRVCLPLLMQGRTPAIVNISSIAGKRGIPARSEYSASKFAVDGFSQALRAEMVRFGIDVLVVNPGLTHTNFSKNMLEQKARLPMDHLRGMKAEAVAEATVTALANGRNEVTLSLGGKLLVWVSRLFPWLADLVARRKVRACFREEIAQRKAGLAAPAAQETAAVR